MIIRYVTLFVAVFWVMGLIVLLAVFSSAMNERKREFAAYRILGANRSTLVGIIVKESAMIGALGGVIGIAVASLAIFPFSTLIGTAAAVAVSANQHVECVGIDRSEFRVRGAYRTARLRDDGGETFRSRNLSDFERR